MLVLVSTLAFGVNRGPSGARENQNKGTYQNNRTSPGWKKFQRDIKKKLSPIPNSANDVRSGQERMIDALRHSQSQDAETRKRNQTRDIQKLLTQLGYYNDSANGLAGEQTHDAIKRFQKDFELEITGKEDALTVRLLHEAAYLQNAVQPHSGQNATAQEFTIGVMKHKDKGFLFLADGKKTVKGEELYAEIVKQARHAQYQEQRDRIKITLYPQVGQLAQLAAIDMKINLLTQAPGLNTTITTPASKAPLPGSFLGDTVTYSEYTRISRRPSRANAIAKSWLLPETSNIRLDSPHATDTYELGHGPPFEVQSERFSDKVVYFARDMRKYIQDYFSRTRHRLRTRRSEKVTTDLTTYIFDKFRKYMYQHDKPTPGLRYHIEYLEKFNLEFKQELMGMKVVETTTYSPFSLVNAHDP
jgi:peptidoglycan hydrolase-like protein with peptidoglycan-binding domain